MLDCTLNLSICLSFLCEYQVCDKRQLNNLTPFAAEAMRSLAHNACSSVDPRI